MSDGDRHLSSQANLCASKHIKWKLCCDLVLVKSAEIKKMSKEIGEEGQRGRENRRKGISAERARGGVCEGKNAKQKRKRVKTWDKNV